MIKLVRLYSDGSNVGNPEVIQEFGVGMGVHNAALQLQNGPARLFRVAHPHPIQEITHEEVLAQALAALETARLCGTEGYLYLMYEDD